MRRFGGFLGSCWGFDSHPYPESLENWHQDLLSNAWLMLVVVDFLYCLWVPLELSVAKHSCGVKGRRRGEERAETLQSEKGYSSGASGYRLPFVTFCFRPAMKVMFVYNGLIIIVTINVECKLVESFCRVPKLSRLLPAKLLL